MKIDIRDRSGVHVVQVVAEKITGEDHALLQTVTPLLDAPGARIVIDLSQVKLISSSGLGDLVTLTARANQYESHVVLAGPSPFVAGVLATTQLDRFFQVQPTVEAAIESLP
jgi:anti-sigma B factor antagonist